jgi:hypothetical protein
MASPTRHYPSVGSVANLAIFGGRQIGAAVEALLPKDVIQGLSVLPIVVVFVAATVSVMT